jgi:hypothetical protein
MVESELDAILLYQLCSDLIIPIATKGTQSGRHSLVINLLNYWDSGVLLAHDNDKLTINRNVTPPKVESVGYSVNLWWQSILKSPNLIVKYPSDCKDIGDLYKNGYNIREFVLSYVNHLKQIK